MSSRGSNDAPRWDRREFLKTSGVAALSLVTTGSTSVRADLLAREQSPKPGPVRLFLGGDVMTGRGIDQVLPHPGSPELYESYARSALDYVELAGRANGPIAAPVSYDYVWGDALAELEEARPAARIVNLETAVTVSRRPSPKGIHYRMHPRNVECLTAAGIDCCVLANNHVLDWGRPGLRETLETLRTVGIETAGTGQNLEEAARPAVLPVPGEGRILVCALGSRTSGIPDSWAAGKNRPGVALLSDLSDRTVDDIARRVQKERRPGDVVVASIHWGGNWGYRVPSGHRRFARRLLDRAAVDVIHGHSSHHPKGIEVHRDRLILYGCGDFLNDYEGIGGFEEYRGDLTFMYLPTLDPSTGKLLRLVLIPFRIRRFRLEHATRHDAAWLEGMMNREGRRLGSGVRREGDALVLTWS